MATNPTGVLPEIDPKTLGEVGHNLADFVVSKNLAYGDAVTVSEAVMLALFPDGIPPEKIGDALLMVRTIDKLCRIARGDKTAFGESPWSDVGGYGVLGATRDKIRG